VDVVRSLKEVQEEDDDRMLARASSQMNFILGAYMIYIAGSLTITVSRSTSPSMETERDGKKI
jgi:hypothetical protein